MKCHLRHATLVLGHIQRLRKAGIGYRVIGAATGFSKSTITLILTGERLQIRRHHADRILAVDRTAIADRAPVVAGRTRVLVVLGNLLPRESLTEPAFIRREKRQKLSDWGAYSVKDRGRSGRR
jgi:hypothetical protein